MASNNTKNFVFSFPFPFLCFPGDLRKDKKNSRKRETYRNFLREESEIRETRIAIAAAAWLGPNTTVLQKIADHHCQVMLALMAEPADLADPSAETDQKIAGRHAHPTIHIPTLKDVAFKIPIPQVSSPVLPQFQQKQQFNPRNPGTLEPQRQSISLRETIEFTSNFQFLIEIELRCHRWVEW